MYTDTHIRNNTPAQIYMHRTKQYTYTLVHNMHTICTQFAHTQTINNMQHTEDNREHNREQDTGATEKNIYTSTENSAHNYRTYSFDFMFNRMYQKTL